MLASFLLNGRARLYLPQIFLRTIIWFAGRYLSRVKNATFLRASSKTTSPAAPACSQKPNALESVEIGVPEGVSGTPIWMRELVVLPQGGWT
jgi:hypothetical protein